ncbi:hypothetical protein [Haloactinospora alba]|nr:hypothetical protein [Haloactinospora alba]
MSHRDGGICYRCGALPAHRAKEDDGRFSRRLTYHEARERYGKVVDVLTELAKAPKGTKKRFCAREAIYRIQTGVTQDTGTLWENVDHIRTLTGNIPPNM